MFDNENRRRVSTAPTVVDPCDYANDGSCDVPFFCDTVSAAITQLRAFLTAAIVTSARNLAAWAQVPRQELGQGRWEERARACGVCRATMLTVPSTVLQIRPCTTTILAIGTMTERVMFLSTVRW